MKTKTKMSEGENNFWKTPHEINKEEFAAATVVADGNQYYYY